MRYRLIHDDLGVDYQLVWDVVQNRIPELRRQIVDSRGLKLGDSPLLSVYCVETGVQGIVGAR